MLDVGQGQCVWLHTADNRNFLFDVGGSLNAATPLRRALRAAGVRRVSGVFLSHGDFDHVNALPELLDYFDVQTVYYPQDLEIPDFLEAVSLTPVADGTRFVFSPEVSLTAHLAAGMACYSVEAYGLRLLTTGDLTAKGIRELLQRDVDLRCDILLIPHHGGKNDRLTELLEAAAPSCAWISCGRFNKYNHPAVTTLDALEGLGIALHQTGTDGYAGVRYHRSRWLTE